MHQFKALFWGAMCTLMSIDPNAGALAKAISTTVERPDT